MKSLLKGTFSCVLFILCFVLRGNSQAVQSATSDYANSPVWISMIDKPETNYYEAIKAYEAYWKVHVKPVNSEEEEEGFINEPANEREREKEERKHRKEKKPDAAQLKQMEERDRMIYQCKRFENWKQEVLPFVQEDGRILTMQERQALGQKK